MEKPSIPESDSQFAFLAPIITYITSVLKHPPPIMSYFVTFTITTPASYIRYYGFIRGGYMDTFLQQAILDLGPDVADALEVFFYTNLSAIISPNPSILLTPAFQAALQSALNDIGIRHNIGLANDLKDVLDVFITDNASIIAVSTTP